MGQAAPLPPAEGRRRILVPGQVEDDASIRKGAGEERTNLALLQRVRAANPDAQIIYKPHPDVEAGLRPGVIDQATLAGLADLAGFAALADLVALAGFVALAGLALVAGLVALTGSLALRLRLRADSSLSVRESVLASGLDRFFLSLPRLGFSGGGGGLGSGRWMTRYLRSTSATC